MRCWVVCSLLAVAGCSTKLETGYEPTKLGATPVQRRGWYAPDFSVEQQAGQQDNASAPINTRGGHRPGAL